MVRADIQYIGQYRGSARARQVLKQLGSSTSVVADWYLLNKLTSVGFQLDPERDNKSVWTPEWIRTGLKRFGDVIPTALEEWELGGFDPSEYSTSALGGHPALSRARGEAVVRGSKSRGVRSGRAESARSRPPRSGARGSSRLAARGHDRVASALGNAEGSALSDNVVRRMDGGSLRIDPRVYEHAKAATFAIAACREGRRKPHSLDEVVDKFVHPSHFSGAPFFTRNERVLEDAISRARGLERAERAFDPYVAGRRIQHGPSGPKGRLVWMAPLATTLVATRYSKAVYEGIRKLDCFAYGARKSHVGAKVSSLQTRYRRVISVDFSAFDARLPAEVLDDVFGILKTWLDLSEEDERVYSRLTNDFIHSRIVLPDGSMWQKHRGVPSGNPFTSLVDSVANLLVMNYCLIKNGHPALSYEQFMILGDDSMFGMNHYVDMAALSSAASDLGMVISPEKSSVATLDRSVEFLGHHWSNGRAHRPLWDLAVRMAFPERHMKRTKSDSLTRFYSYAADADEWIDLLYMVRMNWGSYMNMVRTLVDEIDGDEINTRAGPGRLQYLEAVSPELLPAGYRKGPSLAVYGLMV